MYQENLKNGVKSGKCCLSPKDEFFYRHGMAQIVSYFILGFVSFGTRMLEKTVFIFLIKFCSNKYWLKEW